MVILILAVPIQMVSATPPYSNSLSVVRSQQSYSNWCWAASSKMIGDYLGHYKSQSDIVTAVKGSAVNVGALGSEVCIALAYATDYSYYTSIITPPAISSIKSQIDLCIPIMMRMDWTSGGSHNVVVKGYSDSTKLIVVDPGVGCSQIKSYEYSDLQNGVQILSGYGRCTNFYHMVHR